MTIEARGITKRFGDFVALRDVRLQVKEGETVFENVAFGLRVQPRRARPGCAEIRARVEELLALVQLESLAGRLPSQLSGGQRQRVALARALAVRLRVLLLDEPFGAFDSRVRKELRRWLRGLHDELHITSVFVTHDQEEALELADRVVVRNHGRIEQEGTPEQVYHEPATRFVTEFLGDVNIFHARVERGLASDEGATITIGEQPRSERASIYVRPHLLEVHRAATGSEDMRARGLRVHAAGPTVKVELATEGGTAQAELSQEQQDTLRLRRGEQVYVRPRQKRVFVGDYEI